MLWAILMADGDMESNPRKLKVLQIISSPEMGGIENQLLAFLQRYDRGRFQVDVACAKSTEGSLRDRFLETSTTFILCRWSRYVIPFVWRLLRLLHHKHYDVVHVRGSEVSGAAILAARLAGVSVRVASYHHSKIYWRKTDYINRLITPMAIAVLQWMERRWATRILSISQACFDVYFRDWRQHPELFQICHNGIDIERFSNPVAHSEVRSELGLPMDSLVVGHVGGFRKVKNHQTFVDMAERVSKQLEKVHFLLVGDGALRQQIEMEVAKRGLSSRFVFTGNRDDVPRMLAAMDIFVMPSLNEGFGSVVIEAQLAGLVVVASDLPSIREALGPAMHQFCRQPHDSAGMAEQVLTLLQSPQLRNSIGSQAREYATERFSIDRTVKQLEAIYDSALHKVPR